MFCKYSYLLKSLNYFRKKFFLDNSLGSKYASEISKVYTNVQGKINPYEKMKRKCKNWSGQIVRTAILKCSKKFVFKILGKRV